MQTKRIRTGKSFWLRWMLVMTMVLAVGLLLTRSAVAQEGLPSLSELTEGWNMLSPGGDTRCALGTAYHFFVHPGSENKLLIHFEGGDGWVWDEATAANLLATGNEYQFTVPANDYHSFMGSYDEHGNPISRTSDGIVDFENADNPFRNYTAVFIPHCTSDSHLGDNVVTYGEGEDAITIRHKGHVNATAALEWAYANVGTPESVFVTGCEAGNAASALEVPNIAAHYAGVPMAQLGDGGGGTRLDDYSFLLEPWGTMDVLPDLPEYTGMVASELSIIGIYSVTAVHYPNITLSQVNTAHDRDQQPEIEENLQLNLNDIHAAAPNFRSYVGWGDAPCMTLGPEFYTHQVNGVRLLDWVAALAAGEDVEDVQCIDCESEELYEGS